MINNDKKQENDSRLNAIFENVSDGIITIDDTGIIETVNPAALKMFGYDQSELIGSNVNLLMPEPYHSQHDQYIENYKQTGNPKIIGKGREVLGKRKDGSVFPFYLSVSEIKLENRIIFTGIIHDISELRHIEDELFETNNKINSIINMAVDGIITIDEQGIMEMVNPAACQLFGYEHHELIGKKVNMLMPEPHQSHHDQYIQHYIQTGEAKIIGIGREVEGLKKDGTIFPLNLSVSEIKVNNRRIFTGIIHDITEQKNAEEKLRKYAKDLERSNRELEDFAYVSSHDLQEPLRKIRAFGDRLLKKEYNNISEESKDYFNRMLNAAERMQNLINDLLMYSRITSYAKPFEKVNLNHILTEALSDLEISVENSGAQIDAQTLPEIYADKTQMRQLFQNIITNAIKFSKQGVPPEINISWQQLQPNSELYEYNFIEIIFQDNGVGFDQKYSSRIFKVFQRLEGQKHEGSGIGLAICKKIAQRHGGDIIAESEAGKGTKIKVTLAKNPNNHGIEETVNETMYKP